MASELVVYARCARILLLHRRNLFRFHALQVLDRLNVYLKIDIHVSDAYTRSRQLRQGWFVGGVLLLVLVDIVAPVFATTLGGVTCAAEEALALKDLVVRHHDEAILVGAACGCYVARALVLLAAAASGERA